MTQEEIDEVIRHGVRYAQIYSDVRRWDCFRAGALYEEEHPSGELINKIVNLTLAWDSNCEAERIEYPDAVRFIKEHWDDI